jgi:hypothetical protein
MFTGLVSHVSLILAKPGRWRSKRRSTVTTDNSGAPGTGTATEERIDKGITEKFSEKLRRERPRVLDYQHVAICEGSGAPRSRVPPVQPE